MFKNTFFIEHHWRLLLKNSSYILIRPFHSTFMQFEKDIQLLILCKINTPPDVYSEPCQTSKMERFAKIVNG